MRRAAAALVLLVALATPATAPAAQPRASFNDIEGDVMCDTCNVPLNIADSPRADQERREIKGLIAEGLTKQQILAELKRRYGPAILATPQDSGFSLAVWIVPIAVVIGVLAALVIVVPRWRRRDTGAAASPAVPELSTADARRIEEDLARYDV